MKACRGAGELLAWGSCVWKLRRGRRWAGRLNGLPLKAWIETERFWHQVPVQFILQAQPSTSTTKLCKLRDRLKLACLCVWKCFFFFFYCWHTQREFVFRKWYILPGITGRFEMTNNPEFPYNTGSYIVHMKLACLSECLSIYFVPLLHFELDFSQLLNALSHITIMLEKLIADALPQLKHCMQIVMTMMKYRVRRALRWCKTVIRYTSA